MAADYLRISQQTLRRWEKQGILVPMRTGKRKDREYTMELLNDFLYNRNTYFGLTGVRRE
jgi:DNA-binding transcriptional MerR regulator